MKSIIHEQKDLPEKKRQKKTHAHICFADTPSQALTSEDNLNVALGLVKVGHIYETCFQFPKSTDNSHEHEISEDEKSFEFLRCNVRISNKGKVTFEAVRQGTISETLDMKCSVCGESFDVELTAKVMGSSSGTPSLKEGVHCVGTFETTSDEEVNSDSENDL